MARNSSLLPASALLLLVGCGEAASGGSGAALSFDPCQPLAVVPESGVTPDQLDGIAAGIALWNRLAAAQLTLSLPGAPAPAAAALPIEFQRAAGPFHGFYDDQAGRVFINDDLAGHERVVTIAHEVGHAFALVHVAPEERSSVMNAGNLAVEPTADDIATLAARWGRCPP